MTGTTLIDIIRTDIGDLGLTFREVFNYEVDAVYTLSQDNINASSIEIKIDGTPIAEVSGASYTYDDGEVTFTGLTPGNAVVIKYEYNDYSDSQIKKFINSAISRIALHLPHELEILEESANEFSIMDSEVSPVAEITNKWYGLVALIAQILIKPDWVSYKTLDVTITYAEKLTKDEKVLKVINDFRADRIGVFGTIDQITQYQQISEETEA